MVWHALDWFSCPFEKHGAHSAGGLAPEHSTLARRLQAVWFRRLPGMHTLHMGLTLAGARFDGHELALA